MRLIWSDECNRAAGTPPYGWDVRVTDAYQNGTELQRYTTDIANAQYDGQGHLVLQAIKTGASPFPYTSAKLSTPRDLGDQLILGGMVEARIKCPIAVGVWPAFWMLGQDSIYGWPACGEIDVMEQPSIAGQPLLVHQGTHTASNASADVAVGVPPVSDYGHGNWHTYSIVWAPDQIDFYVDANYAGRVSNAAVTAAGGHWTFNHRPMYLILNLAVGGWAGAPDPSWLNQQMLVDYVRVYG